MKSNYTKLFTGSMSSIAFPIHLVWPTLPFMPLKTRLAIDYLAQHLPSKQNKQV